MADEPKVRIKNTFVEVEDRPRPPELERSRSEPNRSAAPTAEDDDGGDLPTDLAGRDLASQNSTGSCSAPPPPRPELNRYTTNDGFEPSSMASWVSQGGDPAAFASSPSGASASAAAADAANLAASGPRVFVKNTFLDLDPPRRMADLERSRSEPNPTPVAEDSSDEDGSEAPADGGGGGGGGGGDEGASLEAELDVADDGDAPPAPGSLYRTTTCDGWEPSSMWEWVQNNGDPNAANAAAAAAAASAAAAEAANNAAGGVGPSYMGAQVPPMGTIPAGFPGGAVGYVMVPVPMPMQMMAPTMDASAQSTMQAVPVDRFTRWPQPLQASEGEATAPGAAGPPAEAPPAMFRIETPGQPPPGTPSVPEEQPLVPQDITIPPAPDVPRAPVLQRAFSLTSQIYRIRWTVDASKLKKSDKEAVSPSFLLSFARDVEFKMVIRPKSVHDQRGGASFKKAKGKGSVFLRCLEQMPASCNPVVNFRLAVGGGAAGEAPRGPVRHDFSERAICGLPDEIKEWDFSKHVDQETQTFVICLEILSAAAAAASGATVAAASGSLGE